MGKLLAPASRQGKVLIIFKKVNACKERCCQDLNFQLRYGFHSKLVSAGFVSHYPFALWLLSILRLVERNPFEKLLVRKFKKFHPDFV